ncbi:CaiB/BaiF CoA transferase family protein [Candidimonas nitroreducens]|uniref:Carnitine dehydratase n=1 Tax=Candidimonas nitroreducens TaxID=683354 RepID=A0A225MRV4_9BURK|nr:CaiB/BaiF CoA-transferase family protein [Candidimonas nitroreducens]OWT63948.1 carnitine dehydratase [Candidimonas nitroreducens]
MGPLAGIKVVEFAALGPAPMGAMLLADLGAEVVRIERKVDRERRNVAPIFDPRLDILNRGKRVVVLDLKKSAGVNAAARMIARADVLVEGFRPGVMERLGLGPEICLKNNPRLIYGRMTGWGQIGPLAHAAGHDINYLSLTGALHAIGGGEGKPVVPLNLVADCGGGAMLLVVGLLAAVVEARNSGRGQVVDAAMTDGTALLMSMIYTLKAMGQWKQSRASNLLDGGAHFYDTYQCRDGKWLAVGAIEPQFYALLLEKLGITDPAFDDQWRREQWPFLKEKLASLLARRTRDEWCELFEGSDACIAPVLDMDEAPKHPHNEFRQTFINVGGIVQPAPAPRFSRTSTSLPTPPSRAGDVAAVLKDWDFTEEEIIDLRQAGAL